MKVVNMQLWLVVFSFYASLASGKRKIRFYDTTVDSRCSNCFRQILRINEIQICLYVFNFILPSQKRKQYHILRLLEDRFSPRTQSTPGAGTLTQILQK